MVLPVLCPTLYNHEAKLAHLALLTVSAGQLRLRGCSAAMASVLLRRRELLPADLRAEGCGRGASPSTGRHIRRHRRLCHAHLHSSSGVVAQIATQVHPLKVHADGTS